MTDDDVTTPKFARIVDDMHEQVDEYLRGQATLASFEDAALAGTFTPPPCGCRALTVPNNDDGTPDYRRARVSHSCGL